MARIGDVPFSEIKKISELSGSQYISGKKSENHRWARMKTGGLVFYNGVGDFFQNSSIRVLRVIRGLNSCDIF